jgi:hypothetical protein
LGRRRVIESIPNKIKRLEAQEEISQEDARWALSTASYYRGVFVTASEWIRTVTEAMGAPSGIASKHAVTIIESRRKK